MRIALVAPIEEPVPPAKYGGTELVVYNCCQEMVKLGHEVYLFAAGDSQTDAQLVSLFPKSLRQMYSVDELDTFRNVAKLHQLGTVLKELKRLQPDIVFNHQGWRLIPFLDSIDCPVYTTIHGSLDTPAEQYTYRHYPQTPLISISNHQRKAMPSLNWVKTVYNGIDVDQFQVTKQKKPYFAFLGRTSPEKGLKEICQMIKQTNHQLKIAAKIDPADIAYYETEIKPLIDGKQIQYIGEIGPEEKQTFLQQAQALLLWLNWEEPFGLVVVEAMASGTPVIVNRRGSMPELITHQKTGFLINSVAEMAQQLDQAKDIDPLVCRQRVIECFSASRMAQDYLELAGKVRN